MAAVVWPTVIVANCLVRLLFRRTSMGICASQQDLQAAEHAAWLAGGKEICCINCRISAGEFNEKLEVSLNQRLSVSTAKTVIVQQSSYCSYYEHNELVAAGDAVLEMGNTALDDAQTLEDEGVEEGATLTMIVDVEVISELIILCVCVSDSHFVCSLR